MQIDSIPRYIPNNMHGAIHNINNMNMNNMNINRINNNINRINNNHHHHHQMHRIHINNNNINNNNNNNNNNHNNMHNIHNMNTIQCPNDMMEFDSDGIVTDYSSTTTYNIHHNNHNQNAFLPKNRNFAPIIHHPSLTQQYQPTPQQQQQQQQQYRHQQQQYHQFQAPPPIQPPIQPPPPTTIPHQIQQQQQQQQRQPPRPPHPPQPPQPQASMPSIPQIPQMAALQAPQLSQQPHLSWSTMSFSYNKNGTKRNGTINLPINFKYTPILSSLQPFQYQRSVPFSWSAVNEQLMHKLFKFDIYFENKVVLELGSGFGIPSIISLYLGAKHVYITDGNDDILSLIPIIMNKNAISSHKYSVSKLIFAANSQLNDILIDCRNNLKQSSIDIILISDVLNTNETAMDLYKTISFYFNQYIESQRIKFRRVLQKEFENKQSTPNVQYQFNMISRKDLNKPVTNGGYLPYSLKPKEKQEGDGWIATSIRTDQQQIDTPLSVLSHSDDDSNSHSNISISTNSIPLNNNTINTQLPNTVHSLHLPEENSICNDNNYQYKAPHFQPGISSISAITTIADVQEIDISRFNKVQYDEFNLQNQQNQNKQRIPKLTIFNNAFNEDSDGDSIMNTNEDNKNNKNNKNKKHGLLKQKQVKIDKKEEDEFISKSKVNAPICIIAHHKKNRNRDIKLADNQWNTFYNKCINDGYRLQNILFEWDYEVWIVKA